MQRLPEEIKVKHEKMKEEMIGLSDKNNIYLIYSTFQSYLRGTSFSHATRTYQFRQFWFKKKKDSTKLAVSSS